MKKISVDKKNVLLQIISKTLYWIFLGAVITVSVWIWLDAPKQKIFNDYANNDVWFGEGWFYTDDNGQPNLDNPVVGTNHHYLRLKANDGKVSIARVVGANIKDNEYFMFRVRSSSIKIYVNDTIWYKRSYVSKYKEYANKMYILHQVKANTLKKKDIIRIELKSDDLDYFILQYPAIGDRYGLLFYIMDCTKASWIICLIAISLFVLNIIAGHSPILVDQGRNLAAIKWLNSFLAISVVYLSMDSGCMELFIGKVAVTNWFSSVALLLTPMPFIMYTQCEFFPGHRSFEILSLFNFFLAIWSIIKFITVSYNLANSFMFVHILIGVSIVAGVVSFIQEKETPPIEVVVGYLSIVISALASIYTYWKGLIYPCSTIYGYGLVIFCFFMLLWIVRSSNEMRRTREAVQFAVMKRDKLEAEEASEQKTRFLSHMSHEIRTPLNAVLGMNELIMNETKDDKILKYAKSIENAGHTLLALINDVLDFSKIETGKMTIIKTDYSLSTALHDTTLMVKDRAKSKNLDFKIDVAADIPDLLHGDEIRIKQIVLNLLTNAIKYTPEGWIKLKVYKEAPQEEQNEKNIKLHIEVSDSGMGIKKEELPLLFKEFERLDGKKNRSIEGTGLGLSITSKLVKLMHGSLDVESEYEKGSTFKVVIPQKVVSPEPIGNYKERLASVDIETTHEKQEHQTYPGKRVFVVDDNDVNLEVIAALLEMLEIKVEKVNSGAQAIEILDKKCYDLILTDDMMPEMNGTQLMQYIKSNDKGKSVDTPIVVLTANAVVGAREEYIKHGFDDYLSKPIDIDMLQKVLTKYLLETK